jgi:hypothetical protein
MKHLSAVLVAVLPFIGSGCGFMQNIRRNVVAAPLYRFTDIAENHRNEQLAREAYVQMAMNFRDQEFSCDYRRGFVDGFVDLLNFGGFGEPPPVPPPSYRLFGYMTPEGLAAMEDWKNGFRHGAATARASNLRELVTLPVNWGPVYQTVPKNAPRQKAPNEDKKVMPAAPPEPPLAKPIDQPMPMDPVRPQ